MLKIELYNRVAEHVVGRNLSPTDVRLTYNQYIEDAGRDGEISEYQRLTWVPTKKELKRLEKITKQVKPGE